MAADRNRIAAALAYEQERRRRLAEFVPTPSDGTMTTDQGTDLATNLQNLSSGLGRGLTTQLQGLKGIVTDPVGSAKAGYEAVKGIVRDPSVLAEALRQTGQRAMSGALGAGEVIGEMAGPMRNGGVGRRDIFIGKSAKTWNQKEADRALAMEAYGVDPETIWKETGTYRGPDREWRQEISDVGAKGKFTHIAPSEQRLSDVAIEHPELVEAYPDLAKAQQFGLKGPKGRGSYEAMYIQTEEGPKLLGETLIVEAPTEETLAGVGIHELQHAIQRREGFERGANPREFKDKKIPAKLKDVAFAKSMREMAIANRMRELGYPVAEGKVLNLSRPDIIKKVKEFGEKDPNLLLLLGEHQQAAEKLKKYPDKYTQYVRSAGEVEARAAEARRFMSPEERRATFPPKSFDVPLNEVILKKK